ncbi:MAG: six-hairpin glycosidase [Ignavibacteria bacterium GWB2_35_6b]|nr:MAG: six-hairpin glycosidase [Ignavibacteria bacterium GWB2_35_6b]
MKKILPLIIIVFSLTGWNNNEPNEYLIQPVDFTQVKFEDNFWLPRIKTNRNVSIPTALQKCVETGRIDNFAVAGGLIEGEFKGDYPFDDTDVYKIIEGASFSLAVEYDKQLDNYVDSLIALITAAQEDDGYIYTCRTTNCTRKNIIRWMGNERWEKINSHELYNCGHLYEAASAHYISTGKRTLLDVALKNADLINSVFGPDSSQKHWPSGHPIIEMGLVKLYRITGDKKYLNLAKYFIDETGRLSDGRKPNQYSQDHKPIIEQEEAVGHAVRFGYLYSGVADVAALTNNEEYKKALQRVWENIVSKKLYITGGIGARGMGEGFGNNYELPNMTAYCETCASISNVYWNYRMFLLTGESKYYDVLERTLYNSMLSGVSLSGDRFFYDNILESDGTAERKEWFGCACCPSNVTRFMASIPGYQYAFSNNEIYVNLYVQGKANIKLNENHDVRIEQITNYPWDGKIILKVETQKPKEFNLLLRLPGWAKDKPVPSDLYSFINNTSENIKIKVNGEEYNYNVEKGYAVISREWKNGEQVSIDIPMPVRKIKTHENVESNKNKIALQRGSIVYCLEGKDNNEDYLFNYFLADDTEFKTQYEQNLLAGIVTINFYGKKFVKNKNTIQSEDVSIKAIPYYAWNNRGKSNMLVWISSDEKSVIPKPEPTIASKSAASSSVDWAVGLNDQFEPKSSKDFDKIYFYWWLKNGTEEWVQYTFNKPYIISESQVYWLDFEHYDYTCKPPAEWNLEYQENDKWNPVENLTPYTMKMNEYNVVKFKPVGATAIRINAKLNKDISSGIMEWKVN